MGAVYQPGFIQTFKDAGVAISMDDKGRRMDNVFIERMWHTVKWGCLSLRELENGTQTRRALERWFHFYNEQRPHTAFDRQRLMDVYRKGTASQEAA